MIFLQWKDTQKLHRYEEFKFSITIPTKNYFSTNKHAFFTLVNLIKNTTHNHCNLSKYDCYT